ncbi:MAG TPA: sulfatase/phosphatase domain-containing protein, partial [Pseudomonadales bacterium]|nr:sulfatase/phosphatase domain-containing protein [Pseudomonadales bacterium]
LDIYPTLAQLTNIPTGNTQDGNSLLPLLQDQSAPWPNAAFTLWQMHGEQNHFAVVDQRYRLIRYADGTEELYDHEQDPHEWHNIVNKDSYQDIRKDLVGKINDYNKRLSPH